MVIKIYFEYINQNQNQNFVKNQFYMNIRQYDADNIYRNIDTQLKLSEIFHLIEIIF